MKRDQKIIYTLVGGAVLVGGIVLASPNDPAPTKPKTSASTTSAPAKAKNVDYTDADTKVKFEELPSSKNNAFMPTVAKKTIGGKGGSGIMPNSVPAADAGGDGGWLYTGTVVIDNSPSVLMENNSKAEALYLRAGEKWLTCVVQRITPTSVTLVGPGGRAKELELLADPPGGNKAPTSTSIANAANQGALPAANQPAMQAFDPSQITINGINPAQMPAITYQPPAGGGMGRRNRGNRGGGNRSGGGAAAPVAPAPAIGGSLPNSDDDTTVTLPNTPGDE